MRSGSRPMNERPGRDAWSVSRTREGARINAPTAMSSRCGKRLESARTLENVLTELNWLKQEYGLKHVAFVDDLFTVDRARTLEFCRAYERLRLGLNGAARHGFTVLTTA